jgi:hypothetical protein
MVKKEQPENSPFAEDLIHSETELLRQNKRQISSKMGESFERCQKRMVCLFPEDNLANDGK